MPCICGAACNCGNICECQTRSCSCKTCIDLRNSQQPIIESPTKQIHGQNKSPSRKRSAPSDLSNGQMSSLVSDSTPGQSQMIQSSASGTTLGLGVPMAGVTTSTVTEMNPLLTSLLTVPSPPPGPPAVPLKRPRMDITVMESSTSEDDNPSTNEDDNPSTNEDDNPSTNEDDNPIF